VAIPDDDALSDHDRRRQLRFRSWHRGTKEADLLFGTFADKHLETFDRERLDHYARLLEYADPDLWDWLNGHGEPPPEASGALWELLVAHKRAGIVQA
jgi:antitoxin CptB